MNLPIALTCGDPSGIGPELSVKAWQSLGADCPFFWIGYPEHLPEDTSYVAIKHPRETATVLNQGLPVLVQSFPVAAPHGPLGEQNSAESRRRVY